MAKPKKRGNVWGIRVSVGGKRESATFDTKREADDWQAKRRMELKRERSGTLGEIRTLGDALRRYAAEVSPTHKGERWEAVRLKMFGKDEMLPITLPLSKLTTAHISAWKLERSKAISDGSVLRELGLLGAVLTHARREWHWMDHEPMRDVRRPKQPPHRKRLIQWREIRLMLRQLGWRARGRPTTMKQVTAAAFLHALRTGMRAGEIVGLEWGRVRPTWVELEETKNGSSREVPLSRKAVRLIERMRGLDDDLVYPISSQTIDSLFRKARAQAGLSGFTFHDSRHAAATRIGATVGQPGRLSFPEFCAMFGWEDPKHALIYVNPTAASLAAKLA